VGISSNAIIQQIKLLGILSEHKQLMFKEHFTVELLIMENKLNQLQFHSQKLKSINLVEYVVVMEIARIFQEIWINVCANLDTQDHLVINGLALVLPVLQMLFVHLMGNVTLQTHALVILTTKEVSLARCVNSQCAME
jgi:hypothetical protein